ncbi:short-chain dehydrogenase [Frondihabitans sucicola]|uniref:Short-chain dehydrogenase n=1 Tax=Frondihabitans sucicola TaxID=1268041 RepID=A0ABM8GJM2_9MICO|nr:SDR family NAD(P)-dependent oxidoreductase [Frondihabitans sucicola]BDZ48593.1 short-chain dehydrogenase [Frondihabitans sucicola]
MTTTFITGANKGIGYETARQLIERGHRVILGARDADRGEKAAHELRARFVQIDISNDASVDAAFDDIQAHEGGIDVLINNAGILGPRNPPMGAVSGAVADQVLQTNVLGAVRTTHAFLPMLVRSPAPAIVNVSSSMGSFTRAIDPAAPENAYPLPFYQVSKAALNMLTVMYAQAYPTIKINAADPGGTDTDIMDHLGTQTVAEGSEAIVTLATLGANGPTGTFVTKDAVVPW